MQDLIAANPPSLPAWERGLKSATALNIIELKAVAPGLGAWIEITLPAFCRGTSEVAPGLGAWIEITPVSRCILRRNVAPGLGAWIEMST